MAAHKDVYVKAHQNGNPGASVLKGLCAPRLVVGAAVVPRQSWGEIGVVPVTWSPGSAVEFLGHLDVPHEVDRRYGAMALARGVSQEPLLMFFGDASKESWSESGSLTDSLSEGMPLEKLGERRLISEEEASEIPHAVTKHMNYLAAAA